MVVYAYFTDTWVYWVFGLLIDKHLDIAKKLTVIIGVKVREM